MKWHRCVSVVAGLMLVLTASAARAEITMDFVTVGNPGNVADTQGDGYGAVDYVYQIGQYEVTAGQYTGFLNAVAAADPYGLYNTDMWPTDIGCKIERSGSSGIYTYTVANDRANRPVNYVSWGDAARFSNWLHNGQPTGLQGAGTTETGAYSLDGAVTREDLMAITRNADAKYWIPTQNEWYKAAYHKNDGVTGNYWDYPTRSDSEPSNVLADPDPGNNANFRVLDGDPEYTIGDPYYMTEGGAFTNSESPYGTFDQGGNVFEWNELAVSSTSRGVRGGDWAYLSWTLLASNRDNLGMHPNLESEHTGFRVATVPEPGSLTLMLIGALAGLYLWRRRK